MVHRPRRAFTAEMQMWKKNGVMGPGGSTPVMDYEPAAITAALPAPVHASPVAVDNTEVLRAIQLLNDKFDRHISAERTDVEHIQVEIADISGRIRMTKAEIAALRHPLSNDDKFSQATSELGEVVKATETATNTIMARAEELDDIIQELRSQVTDTYAGQRVNDMAEIVVRIFEACNFQDLTGQRITKVVRALTFIEERIDAMMRAWNVKEFETMPLPPNITRMDGDLELHGPQDSALPENFSQDDIDALFD